MKTIIITTDFSDFANHAAQYGLRFGQSLGASRFILYHAFEIPTIMVDVPISEWEHQKEYKESIKKLEKLKADISQYANPDTKIDTVANANHLLAGVERLASVNNASLIVAGSSGKSNFAKFFLGNSTKILMKSVSYPLLIVPPRVSFATIDNIVFACDIKHALKTTPTDFLRLLTKKLDSKLSVVNVEPENQPSATNIIEVQAALQKLLGDIPTDIHFIKSKNPAEGILSFSSENNAKLVVAVARSYSFLENIFHKSVTQQLSDLSEVPLLITRLKKQKSNPVSHI
ncbi:MAG TPA: universal stress protein [Sphingobacterium sp.]|nr:universal stress protein [Sphingobacterium sp.]